METIQYKNVHYINNGNGTSKQGTHKKIIIINNKVVEQVSRFDFLENDFLAVIKIKILMLSYAGFRRSVGQLIVILEARSVKIQCFPMLRRSLYYYMGVNYGTTGIRSTLNSGKISNLI